MTRQEYKELLIQCARDGTFPSMGEDGICMYRGPDGKKCAAGVLIPDEEYESQMEGLSWQSLPSELTDRIRPEGMTDQEMQTVQELHDIWAQQWDPEEFIQEVESWNASAGRND